MELNEVCKTLLDNADMSIDFSAFPKVKLEIYVQGTVKDKHWEVVFDCAQVVHMDAEFDDDSSINDLFVVLGTTVLQTVKKKVTSSIQHRMDSLGDEDPIWQVHLYGDMSLTLVTTEFNWQLIELSEKEYEAVYA